MDVELCDAAERDDVTEIERLIAAGADPNALVHDWTPLQWAAAHGHVAAIAALLAAGAHVDGKNAFGTTPLIFAAANSHTAAVDALIAAGADVQHAHSNGNTALHVALMYGHLDSARVLLEASAKADLRNKKGQWPIDVVRGRRDYNGSLDAVCKRHESCPDVYCRRVTCRFVPRRARRTTKPPSARC